MDHRANIIARELIDNDIDSTAYYTDASVLLAIDYKKKLTAKDLLALMQVTRAQRYRRLKRLKFRGLVEQKEDPWSPPTKRRRTILTLTNLGERVVRILKEHERFKYWKFRIPTRPVGRPKSLPKPKEEIKIARTSIYDVLLKDKDSDFLDEEEDDKVTEEDFDDDAEFELEKFLNELKKSTKVE